MPSTNSKMQNMILHEQQASDYKFPFCFSFCSITYEKSLNLWLFMTKHIIVLFMSFNYSTCQQSVTLSWVISACEKQLKYFLSHECKSPSKESPLGIYTIISQHGLAWSHKCWQFLPLGIKKRQEKTFRARFKGDKCLTCFLLICSQNKCYHGITKSMVISLVKYSRY